MEPLNQIRIGQVSASKRSQATLRQGEIGAKKPEPVASPSSNSIISATKANGITEQVTPEGFKIRESDSGLRSVLSGEGNQVTLADGKAFIVSDKEAHWVDDKASSPPRLTLSQDGKALVSYTDQEQNTVQIDPDSLVYEVLNKSKNLSQVQYPDNYHEVVAFGQYRAGGKLKSYENHVLFDAQGKELGSEGFQNLSFKGDKLSFQLPGGVKIERALVRPLPGQTIPQSSSKSSPDIQQPQAAVADAPPILDVAQPTPPEFSELTDISKDFFAEADKPGVSFDETPSHLVMRQEGHTRAFLLPNGDSFRTDGKHLQVLGENPRARNARIVFENDEQYLAYSDPDGNNHKLDVNSGDYEVSNRQGSLTQGLLADGTVQYGVRGTYTSAAGTPEQYFYKASFGEDGKLLNKDGFDDLKVKGDKLSFTLPTGVATERHLITPSQTDINIPKKLVLTGGVADEWGDDLALAEDLLSSGLANEPSTPGVGGASPSDPASGVGQPPASAPTAPGLVREPLPDGSGSVSILPNGIRIVDGSELYAIDAQGNRLEVQKNLMPIVVDPALVETPPADGEPPAPPEDPGLDPANYLLSVSTPDGVQYTVSNQNTDLIVQSADAKVHQLVSADGSVLTSIVDSDNGFQHMYQWNSHAAPFGTPGTRWDPKSPDRLFVDGSPVGSYKLPFPIRMAAPPKAPPTTQPDLVSAGGTAAPAGSTYPGGPITGQTAQGFRPDFWRAFGPGFAGTSPLGQPGFAAAAPEPYGGVFGPWPGSYTDGAPQRILPAGAGFPGAVYPNESMGWVTSSMAMMDRMARMNMMFYACPFGFF